MLVAGLLRAREYLYTPGFTDEVQEVRHAFLITRGDFWPLTNVTTHIGPLYNYVLAVLFAVFGPGIEIARLTMVVFGCVTVVAAYLLGREWGGVTAGAGAALLVAVNPTHVFINSHIAYSNGLTPVFSTLGLWQLARAARHGTGRSLVWSGLLMGLGLQTHPAALAVLPGCAAFLAWKAPRLLGSRWTALAAVAFLVGYGPLVAYNLLTGFGSLDVMQHGRSLRTDGRPLGPDLYVANLLGYGRLLLGTAAGETGGAVSLPKIAWFGAGAASLAVLARQGNPLPLLATLSTLPVAALFSSLSFDPIETGRFVMPAVVVLQAAVACGIGFLASSIRPLREFRSAAIALALAALSAQPLYTTLSYREDRPVDNRAILQALAAIETGRRPGELLALDRQLRERRGGYGVRLGDIFEVLFQLHSIPARETLLEPDDVRNLLARSATVLAVLDGENVPRLQRRFDLEYIAGFGASGRNGPEHAVYRITGRP